MPTVLDAGSAPICRVVWFGSRLCTVAFDGGVRVFWAATNECLCALHPHNGSGHRTVDGQWSVRGTFIATLAQLPDACVRVYSTKTQDPEPLVSTLRSGNVPRQRSTVPRRWEKQIAAQEIVEPASMAWSQTRDNLLGVAWSDRSVRVYEVKFGTELYRFAQPHSLRIEQMCFAPSSGAIACLATASADGTVKLFPETGFVCTLDAHAGNVTCLQFSRDGRFLATGGRDRRVQLWKLRSARLLCTTTTHRGWITDVRWSPCDRYVLSTAIGTCPRVWRTRDATIRCTLYGSDFYWNTLAAWSACGTLICVADCGGSMRLHRARDGVCIVHVSHAHSEGVTSVAWGAFGLATGSYDATVSVWPDGRMQRVAPQLGRSARSPVSNEAQPPQRRRRAHSAPPRFTDHHGAS